MDRPLRARDGVLDSARVRLHTPGPDAGGAVAQNVTIARASLRSPRAAAIAGIAFALLLGTALVLVRIAIPANPRDAPTWLDDRWHKDAVVFALNLVPFAGLVFLWFVGVIRDRIGAAEDRLFATVFLGTGLLFVVLLFVAGAVAGGLIAAESQRESCGNLAGGLAIRAAHDLSGAYGLRDADGRRFAIVTTTIALRLRILPRWLTGFEESSGSRWLLAAESFAWVVILFPVWVFVLSVLSASPPP